MKIIIIGNKINMYIRNNGPFMNVCDNAWYLLYNLINKMLKQNKK